MKPNGVAIASFRELNGLNLTDLAAKSGLSISYLSELENGRDVRLRAGTAKRLADALSVPISAIATVDDRPAKAAS